MGIWTPTFPSSAFSPLPFPIFLPFPLFSFFPFFVSILFFLFSFLISRYLGSAKEHGVSQPIGMLGRSSGNHDWLLANASACVSCGFRLRNARNASDCVWMETGLQTRAGATATRRLWEQLSIACRDRMTSVWQPFTGILATSMTAVSADTMNLSASQTRYILLRPTA